MNARARQIQVANRQLELESERILRQIQTLRAREEALLQKRYRVIDQVAKNNRILIQLQQKFQKSFVASQAKTT